MTNLSGTNLNREAGSEGTRSRERIAQYSRTDWYGFESGQVYRLSHLFNYL